MARRGELPLARKPRQGRALAFERAQLEALRAGKLGPSRGVRIVGHVWAQVRALLPAVTVETLATEIAGALRAAASVGGVGRRSVSVETAPRQRRR